MTEYVEVTKLMECTPDEEVIEIGKTYKPDYHKCNGFAREIRKIQYEMQRLEYYINTLEEEHFPC